MKNRKINHPHGCKDEEVSALSWYKCTERQCNANQTEQIHAQGSIQTKTSDKPQKSRWATELFPWPWFYVAANNHT